MARIRSLLPGVFTDEAWASVSVGARWLAAGILTEADDNGVFEWKPLQIKMRIFPADNVDVPALLAELTAAGIVRRFEDGGRPFGALKNFCKYQRPRKPKSWFPLPPSIAAFVNVDARSVPQKSEPEADEADVVQQKSERDGQREDGGGSLESEQAPNPEQSSVSGLEAFHVKQDARSLFSDAEVRDLALQCPLLDVPAEISELAEWCDREGYVRRNERKSKTLKALRNKQAQLAAADAIARPSTGPPVLLPVSGGLAARYRQQRA